MSDEDDFIRAVRAAPEDDALRLVYADWLEDHDQGPRAELIRVQCALASLAEGDAGRAALEERSTELLDRYSSAWGKGLPGKVQWRRGFPEVFEVRVGEYLRGTRSLKRLAPVQAVRLYEPTKDEREEDDDGLEDDEFIRLTRSMLLDRWTDLEIAPLFLGLDDSWRCFDALVAAPHLTQLRRLSVRNNDCLGPNVCRVAAPKFAHLTHLDIFNSDSAYNGPADEGIARITTSPHMARLEYLDIGLCDVGDDGLCALAASSHMGRLQTLKAEGGSFTDRGLRALSASQSLPCLTHLNLNDSLDRRGDPGAGEDALAVLIESPLLARLNGLGIAGWGLQDADLMRLADRTDASGLRHLSIGGPDLSPAGVRALLSSPSLSQLSHLEWCRWGLTDETASVLLGATQLTHLTVSGNNTDGLSEEMIRRLQDRFVVVFRSDD